MVDRYSAYKALAGVKAGRLVLAFCWAHVRRDFVRVGKGWPTKLKEWALVWLGRISYGTYLWNLPLLYLEPQFKFLVGAGRARWTIAAVSVVAGAASFFLIERPFLRLKKWTGPRTAPLPLSAPVRAAA